MLEILVDNGFSLRSFCFDPSHRSWVDVGWVFGRFGVDLGSIWGRFSVLGGSWEGLGRPWGRHGRPRSIFDRFGVDFEARLGAPNRPKSTKNRCQDAFKLCIGFRIDFESIFVRFWGPFGYLFGVMLGIIWRIGEIAKNCKNTMVFNDFQRSGGRSWPHFPMFLGCLFEDRFLIVLGSVLGSILEPLGLPNGVMLGLGPQEASQNGLRNRRRGRRRGPGSPLDRSCAEQAVLNPIL